MSAYYNEHDPYAAQWLRNLIAAGHIAPGDVDERDIRDVRPDDLRGYTQCHFFAGIGIWSHGLRRAGWPDDAPVWTGSCPCQPFSAAGARGGFADERHLWPHWHHLIAQCAPAIVLGEQIASKDGLLWLDLVSADMEAAGYAFGPVDICAAGFGGAHIRQRLYFVGVADADGESGRAGLRNDQSTRNGRDAAASRRDDGRLAQPDSWQRDGVADGQGRERDGQEVGRVEGDGSITAHSQSERLANTLPAGRSERGPSAGSGSVAGRSASGEMAHHPHQGLEGDHDGGRLSLRDERHDPQRDSSSGRLADADSDRPDARLAGDARGEEGARGEHRNVDDRRSAPGGAGAPLLGRDVADWLFCRDGNWRPVEPGTFPLAHGASSRMGRLRAYGNGLDAETATGFIASVMEAISDMEVL